MTPSLPTTVDDYLTTEKVIDLLLDAICVVDEDGCYVYVSAAFEQIFGYSPGEVMGRRMIELVHPDDRERTLVAAGEIMDGQSKPHFQNRYIRKDGRIIHVMWSARWSAPDGMRIAAARDVTELRRAEAMQVALHAISEAAHAAADLPGLFRHIHQIIGKLLPAANCFVALYDAKNDELSFPYFVDQYDSTPAPRKLDSGTLSAEVIRSGQALLVTPDTQDGRPDGVWHIVGQNALDWLGVPLRSDKGVIGALVVQSYSGEVRYCEQDKALLQFVSTQVAAAIQRKQAEALLQYSALHDALTGLPNRALLHDRLRLALIRAQRTTERVSLLYIDLDHFKPVNDRLGHDIGDLLLIQVAQRLGQCLRAVDTVGRIGGDEFVVVVQGDHRTEDTVAVAQKIRAALVAPFQLSGEHLHVACSIGVAYYPDHGSDVVQLMRRADDAMYEAKRRGGNRTAIALSSMPVQGEAPAVPISP